MAFSSVPEASAQTHNIIFFLTRASVYYSNFWVHVMHGIETVLSRHNYTLSVGVMDDAEMHSLQFPASLNNPAVKGIILVEICDARVCEAVLKYRLPTVTVDLPRDSEKLFGRLDIITMENKLHIRNLVNTLVKKGFQRFAFAGDLYSTNVSKGFQERFDALSEALEQNGLSLDVECSFLAETDQQLINSNYIIDRFRTMKHLPDLYVCGNDWTAIQLMHAAQFLGYTIPSDFSIIGFDNIVESEHTIPPLTTINTPKEQLGIAAANCLIERIQNPDIPYVYSQYMTTLVSRKSIAI
ncbi:MAG: substrate-binding domain-containing protein [Clostridiales bacterium]|nr:substrate-binding domain-containing protein [Clostridiales bacterium]